MRRRRSQFALPLLLVALGTLAGCGAGSVAGTASAPPSSTVSGQPAAPPAGCRTDPHAGVHDPERLKILNPCATFVGTVSRAPKLNPSDGDVTLNVSPDPGYESMLNDKNRQEGGLHVEIVPMDQPGCTPGQPITGNVNNLGVCSGADVVFPPLGAHVRVIGPWVLDLWVGWNEIHPAWRIEILPAAGPPPPEKIPLRASLTGAAERGAKGAPRGRGTVSLTISTGRLCWRFAGLRGIDRPTKATLNEGGPRRAGPVVIALGSRFQASGCASADAALLDKIATRASAYYVNVATARYKAGAIRGQLDRTGD